MENDKLWIYYAKSKKKIQSLRFKIIRYHQYFEMKENDPALLIINSIPSGFKHKHNLQGGLVKSIDHH